MGIVIRWPRHARASKGSRSVRKSSAVTRPSVSKEIFSATSREGHPLPSQSAVIHPAETPIERAKSPRLIDRDSRYSASFIADWFSVAKTLVQVKLLASLHGQDQGFGKSAYMPKIKSKHKDERKREVVYKPSFVRAWRKFRNNMTQEELAFRIDMSPGNLSNIETGVQGYTQENLEIIALVLGCHPADLVAGKPGEAQSILTIWERATPEQRKQILKVASALICDQEEPSAVPRMPHSAFKPSIVTRKVPNR